MGCCNSTPKNNKRSIFVSGLQKYAQANENKFNQIISKGPILGLFENDRKQSESLPRTPLKVYDQNGFKTNLQFETDAVFSNPEKGSPDRIFYNEIKKFIFVPINKYGKEYDSLLLDTKLGNRAYFYIPHRYKDLITKILSEQ